MSNRNANAWKMELNASLQSGETKCQNNRFILKCFFKITFLMIRNNWAHSHNIRYSAELAADCGAKEIFSHLLTALKNAKYHHCTSQSTLKLCLIISSNRYWKRCVVIYTIFTWMRQLM